MNSNVEFVVLAEFFGSNLFLCRVFRSFRGTTPSCSLLHCDFFLILRFSFTLSRLLDLTVGGSLLLCLVSCGGICCFRRTLLCLLFGHLLRLNLLFVKFFRATSLRDDAGFFLWRSRNHLIKDSLDFLRCFRSLSVDLFFFILGFDCCRGFKANIQAHLLVFVRGLLLHLLLILFLLLCEQLLLSLELFKLFFLLLGLGCRFFLLLLLGQLGCLSRSFFFSLEHDGLFFLNSLLFLLCRLLLNLILLLLLPHLAFLLLFVLFSFAFSFAKCFTLQSLRFLLLLELLTFKLSLALFLLALSIPLGPFEAFELLLDLKLLILGRLSLLGFLNERSHALRSESLKLINAALGTKISCELYQNLLGGIPTRSKITISFFFNDDLFENSFD